MMPFTTIYKFMWKDLGLHGAEKEFFAVIYGFWRRSKAPVEIPIRTVTEITGLSRTSVIMAKRGLLKKELVAAQEIRGKPTRYEVLIPDPLENRTGADSERGPVQKSNGYPSGNYTGAETAPKYNSYGNNKTKEFSYGKNAKTSQIVLALVKNSLLPTRNDLVSKLPPQIEGIEKETLEEVLTQIYRKAVESRGIEFQDITGKEVGTKIQKVAEWMMGSPVRSGLLFQGTTGSGKTTLMYAMYGLYKQLASPVIYVTADDLYTHFKRQLEKEASRYEEFLRAKYLFLDELGSEPERCQSYGTDYTPVQNLISYRYDRKLPTIVTTNIADDKILDRYGPRMMDRINEMFSILRFKGDSYRK